jgi:hypothetical protein
MHELRRRKLRTKVASRVSIALSTILLAPALILFSQPLAAQQLQSQGLLWYTPLPILRNQQATLRRYQRYRHQDPRVA